MKKAVCLVLITASFFSCNKLIDYLPVPHTSLPEFNEVFGGKDEDIFQCITARSGSGYVMAGYTYSAGANHGAEDVLVVKLDNNGTKVWEKALGGTGGDRIRSIIATKDGGYIMAGYSFSNDGDATGNHGSYDAWIVKIDEAGAIQWQKQYGGSYIDMAWTIVESNDGGYVVAGGLGRSDSSTNYTSKPDAWVFKLNNSGDMVWQKIVSSGTGLQSDEVTSLTKSSYGGYVLAGVTYRDATDTTFGNHDVLAAKLDEDGNLVWRQTFGNADRQEVIWAMTKSLDGGYVATGNRSLPSNDGHDVLVLKFDEQGSLKWQKTHGGSSADWARSIQATTDGGYILGGATHSNDGDVSGNHGNWDAWVLKLGLDGHLQWQKPLGGSGFEEAYGILPRADGSYVIAGFATSTDGDVPENHGNQDAWVTTLKGK